MRQLPAVKTSAVALKKLTNDITLSAEWDGGLGALVATDGSITQANAESLVNSMYLNLFERAATTADKATGWRNWWLARPLHLRWRFS